MTKRTIALLLASIVLGSGACADSDDAVAPGQNTRVEVISDPAGAAIDVDGQPSGNTTPHTFFDLVGRHDFRVSLRSDNIDYGFRAPNVEVRGDSLHRVVGPLLTTCATVTCHLSNFRNREMGDLRLSTQATGPLFMKRGEGEGLQWPARSSNSYVSTGLPLIAMLSTARDSLALGIYDWRYLAGRPAPVLAEVGGRTTLKQSFWIVPQGALVIGATVRGIEVEEELSETADSNVVLLKLTFRNITNRESYRAVDPLVPGEGMRFDNVYVGFGLDADIGIADDDYFTYEPALDMVYAYDSNFLEEVFNAAHAAQPGLIGLRIVNAPTGAVRVLNGWPRALLPAADWIAGTPSERSGYGVLSGLRSFMPSHPGQQIGYLPAQPSDYRISVSAGPVTLGAGESVSITLAVIMASPVTGQFTSGQVVAPGDPLDTTRQIRSIAATLLERARATN